MPSNQLDEELVLGTLDPHGLLSQSLKGFEPREQQRNMMRNVLDAYNQNAIAIIEAGTGTGKSIAYLIPAMLWAIHNQERTVISTNTITLQEQLVIKDIPLLAKALNLNIQAVLVKGMANYVCLRKLDDARNEAYTLTPDELGELHQIEAWAQTTKEGSKSTLPMIPTHNSWERVCAESDTCSHNQCPFFNDCFFFKARKKAEDAQILVANHHLLFADLSIRADTDNYKDTAVLPNYTRVILDEAHHIEDVATEFFGEQVSKIGMLRALARIASEKNSKAQGKLPLLREMLIRSTNALQPEVISIENRMNVVLPALRREVQTKIQNAFQALSEFADFLQSPFQGESDEIVQGDQKLRIIQNHREHVLWKNSILTSAKEMIDTVKRYIQALVNLETDLRDLKNDRFQEQSKGIRADIGAFTSRLATQSEVLEQFIFTDLNSTKVRWIDSHRMRTMTNVSLIDADLDVSKKMVECLLEKFPSIVFCSATLTTNQCFDFYKKRLGITKEKLPERIITENIYDSPFNYLAQALLTVPTDLPVPQDERFTLEAAEQIWRTIQISRGGVFVLFTSYGMMRQCYNILEKRLTENKYNLFKQGDADRQTILTKFKSSPKAVLFGTDSFWEGVDVVGEALRCVILVKLPFKVPTEPIIQARTEAIQAAGGDPFFDYTLPNAIVKFKQGFGRLIRNKKDRGCIVCLDTRLVTKGYGKQFINSLPNCGKSFAPSEHIEQHMRDFYRRTHYLVMK